MNIELLVGSLVIAALIGCAPSTETRVEPTANASASAPLYGPVPALRASPSAPVSVTPPPPPRWLAATDAGKSIALATSGGAIVAKTTLGQGRVARDLLADPVRGRALVFAYDVDDGYGELVSISVAAASLGPPLHVAFFDGDARFATDGALLVAFEESYGDAWKRLDPAGAELPRWPAPPPLASAPVSFGLAALFAGDHGRLALASIEWGGAWPPDLEDLGPSRSSPPSARLLATQPGELWLFDAADDRLSVRRASAGAEPRPIGVVLGGCVLEQVIGVEHGSRVALLASPPDVLVTLRLDASGTAEDIEEAALGASVVSADPWPAEALAEVAPGELGVATASGVLAFRVESGALTRDVAFDGSSFVAPIASWP